ncbi:Ribosome assembly protein 3 [Candida viswanathii]|uniref:Ribosome assembly protein 3 n=1 Tax=Candida viswanathii TaxID=5486 RepID=A0A367XRW8_9ASCO|nr:Ribosome assembly protein 3 [Candida viswanathii]
MAAADSQNNKKRSNRRRKKRRTEDFSSSSESSSSSDSDQEQDEQDPHQREESGEAPAIQDNINIDDMEIDSDNEAENRDKIPEDLTIEQKRQLNDLAFTTTPVSNLTNEQQQIKNLSNLNEITATLNQTKQKLNNDFLKVMTNEFNDDLDELRTKPDFKSLVLLAKTLQLGLNMFDVDTLTDMLEEEEGGSK